MNIFEKHLEHPNNNYLFGKNTNYTINTINYFIWRD